MSELPRKPLELWKLVDDRRKRRAISINGKKVMHEVESNSHGDVIFHAITTDQKRTTRLYGTNGITVVETDLQTGKKKIILPSGRSFYQNS